MAFRWAAALLAGTIGSGLVAQTPAADTTAKPKNYAYRYRLLGVYDAASGDPVEGAEVSDVLNGNKALTTKTGTVSLMFLPEGGTLVRIRKVGYELQTMTVAISPADTTPITVILSHTTATTLEPVVVRDSAPKYIGSGLRAFEERMKQGFGHFVTENQFRADDGKPLANIILSHVPGLMRTNGPHAESYLVSSRKPCTGNALAGCRQPNCYVSVFQDGIKIYDAAMPKTPPPDFARMDGLQYA
ncbi:MAG TPA: hypothetical protein VEU08_04990, partial [Vicinamibacterales bacterium]|nr:hypothetical protein [Vicinamibacterales bacterium]